MRWVSGERPSSRAPARIWHAAIPAIGGGSNVAGSCGSYFGCFIVFYRVVLRWFRLRVAELTEKKLLIDNELPFRQSPYLMLTHSHTPIVDPVI
jgi:hypothetical protein